MREVGSITNGKGARAPPPDTRVAEIEPMREVVGTGVLPIGNPFGRQVVDVRKQVSIFLWCITNQETMQLIADQFNVTYSSVWRVV